MSNNEKYAHLICTSKLTKDKTKLYLTMYNESPFPITSNDVFANVELELSVHNYIILIHQVNQTDTQTSSLSCRCDKIEEGDSAIDIAKKITALLKSFVKEDKRYNDIDEDNISLIFDAPNHDIFTEFAENIKKAFDENRCDKIEEKEDIESEEKCYKVKLSAGKKIKYDDKTQMCIKLSYRDKEGTIFAFNGLNLYYLLEPNSSRITLYIYNTNEKRIVIKRSIDDIIDCPNSTDLYFYLVSIINEYIIQYAHIKEHFMIDCSFDSSINIEDFLSSIEQEYIEATKNKKEVENMQNYGYINISIPVLSEHEVHLLCTHDVIKEHHAIILPLFLSMYSKDERPSLYYFYDRKEIHISNNAYCREAYKDIKLAIYTELSEKDLFDYIIRLVNQYITEIYHIVNYKVIYDKFTNEKIEVFISNIKADLLETASANDKKDEESVKEEENTDQKANSVMSVQFYNIEMDNNKTPILRAMYKFNDENSSYEPLMDLVYDLDTDIFEVNITCTYRKNSYPNQSLSQYPVPREICKANFKYSKCLSKQNMQNTIAVTVWKIIIETLDAFDSYNAYFIRIKNATKNLLNIKTWRAVNAYVYRLTDLVYETEE